MAENSTQIFEITVFQEDDIDEDDVVVIDLAWEVLSVENRTIDI